MTRHRPPRGRAGYQRSERLPQLLPPMPARAGAGGTHKQRSPQSPYKDQVRGFAFSSGACRELVAFKESLATSAPSARTGSAGARPREAGRRGQEARPVPASVRGPVTMFWGWGWGARARTASKENTEVSNNHFKKRAKSLGRGTEAQLAPGSLGLR